MGLGLRACVCAVQEGTDGVLDQADALWVAVERRVVGLVVRQQRAGADAPLRKRIRVLKNQVRVG